MIFLTATLKILRRGFCHANFSMDMVSVFGDQLTFWVQSIIHKVIQRGKRRDAPLSKEQTVG